MDKNNTNTEPNNNFIPEEVVLVDEKNNVLGTMLKSKVHGKETPLHRAFSIFIFNNKKELLLQQRSKLKKAWPLVWSNSCCGHPFLNESNENAAKRRCKDELGMEINFIKEVSPYRYCFSKDGIQENEICPILIGFYDKELNLNPDEVENIKWINWNSWLDEIRTNSENYSPWCVEESLILEKNTQFQEFFSNINKIKNN